MLHAAFIWHSCLTAVASTGQRWWWQTHSALHLNGWVWVQPFSSPLVSLAPFSPPHWCYCLSFVVLVQGGRSAEVHGQDGPCGGPESLAEGEGEIQEAQRETSPSRHVGVGVGAPETTRPGPGASEELSLFLHVIKEPFNCCFDEIFTYLRAGPPFTTNNGLIWTWIHVFII